MDGDNFKELKPSINNSADSNRPPNTENGISEIKSGSKPATEVNKTETPKSNIDVSKNTDTPSKIEGKITVEVDNEKFKKEQIKTIAKSAVKKQALEIGKKSIPVVGGVLSIVDAISRYQSGDYTGMFTQIASSAIGVVPYVGTTAAVSIQGGLIIRDIYKEVYGIFPENDPLFSTRRDAIVETIKEIDIPAIISETLSDIVKENAPDQVKSETKPEPTKPEPNKVQSPKIETNRGENPNITTPNESKTGQQTQLAEKSSILSMFPSIESIFGGKSSTSNSVTTTPKPNVSTPKPNVNTTSPSTKPVETVPRENPVRIPNTNLPNVNPYPRPNPVAPSMPPIQQPIPRTPQPSPVSPRPIPVTPPVTPSPVPAAPVPPPAAPILPPKQTPVPSPVNPPPVQIPLGPIPEYPVPVEIPTPKPQPAPAPLPITPPPPPPTKDDQSNKGRRDVSLTPDDITEFKKGSVAEPYLIKTAPTLIIYPFIGGNENKIKAKTSERYSKEVRRVREINYEEQRATMEAEPPDQPILEYNVEGVPNRFRMPAPRNIPPAPALGKDN